MIRRLLIAALVALILPAPAAAVITQPAGSISVTFQHGRLPTSAFTDCRDTYVSGGLNHDNNYGGATTLKVANRLTTADECFSIFYCNFAPTLAAMGYSPATHLIRRARFRAYKSTHTGSGPAGLDLLFLHRLLKKLGAQGTANGTFQSLSASYDSTGSIAGVNYSWNGLDSFGLDVNNFGDNQLGVFYGSGTSDAYDDSATVISNLFGSFFLEKSRDPGECSVAGIWMWSTYFKPTPVTGNIRGWQYFDVTDWADGVWTGRYENDGFYMSNSEGTSLRIFEYVSIETSGDPRRKWALELELYPVGSGGLALAGNAGSDLPMGIY